MRTRGYAGADADGICTKNNMSPPPPWWGDIIKETSLTNLPYHYSGPPSMTRDSVEHHVSNPTQHACDFITPDFRHGVDWIYLDQGEN